MILIKKVKQGEFVGSLYADRNGYHYHVRTYINRKPQIVGRSYATIYSRERAETMMMDEINTLDHQQQLFNINDYKKD